MPDVTDRRRKVDNRYLNRAAQDNVAAAWALIDNNFRSDEGLTDVRANKARAVEHLEAAIAAIRGGRES